MYDDFSLWYGSLYNMSKDKNKDKNELIYRDAAIQTAIEAADEWACGDDSDAPPISLERDDIIERRLKELPPAQKYKEESPEEVAADMASTSPFVIETWCSLLKGLNRAGYIICKKI